MGKSIRNIAAVTRVSWLMTYETARDWTSSLFAWRSGARKDFEVKDAPLARRETGVSRRLMAHRLRRRPFRPSLSSKSFRAKSPSSNQCQAAAFGRPSPVSYVSEPGQRVRLDLAKKVFQVHAVDARGEVVVARKLRAE